MPEIGGLTLRQLEYFVAVAQELSVTRAAERLSVTQPWLSRQLMSLERELGIVLFKRGGRRLELTSAGEVFLDGVLGTLGDLSEVRRRTGLAARGKAGRLRIGFVPSTVQHGLTDDLRAYQSMVPDVEITLTAMSSLQQLNALMSYDLDLSYTIRTPFSGVTYERLGCQSLVLALPAHHRCASLDEVPLRQLEHDPFLHLRREASPETFDYIISLFRQVGITPNVIGQDSGYLTVLIYVAAGLGYSIVTPNTHPPVPDVVYRPITGVKAELPLGLAWRTGENSSVVRGYVEAIHERRGSLVGPR